jgi:DNA modification methylase
VKGLARRSAPSVIREHAGLVVYGFRLGEHRLTPVGTPKRAQWLQCLHYLMHLERHVHFWIGDLLAYGEQRWRETYAEMVEKTGYDLDTLRNLKWVASQVHVSQRRENLSFAHHKEVAKLAPAQQRLVLGLAERGGWTRGMVCQETYRLTQTVARPQRLTLDPGLHHGDCRDILDRLPDKSAHLLLTDPPYGLDYISPTRIVPFPQMVNDDLDHAFTVLDEALGHASRKLKPNSHVCVFTSWKTCSQMAEVVANHFTVLSRIAWIKNNWGVGDLEGAYGEKYELVLFAHNGSRHISGRGNIQALHFDRIGSNQLRHPTQKPVALLKYLIGNLSREGGTVLDPFMGSGSSCVAAHNSRRRYIGIEIDRQWYELALQRLADPTSED